VTQDEASDSDFDLAQLETLTLGLGLRISQATQVSHYADTARDFFDVPYRGDSPGSHFDNELFSLFRTRVKRALNIVRQFQTDLQCCGATGLEKAECKELEICCDRLWDWRPYVRIETWTYNYNVYEDQLVLFSSGNRECVPFLTETRSAALRFIQAIAQQRDAPA
jgi:hypothetical protein